MEPESIAYIFRNNRSGGISIESLFANIIEGIEDNIGANRISRHMVPHTSSGFYQLWKNTQYTRQIDSQIVHVAGDTYYTALGLNPDRTVVTFHDCGMLLNDLPALKKKIIKKLWFEWPARHLKWITVISEQTRDELINIVGCDPEKISVIPNCYDPAFRFAEYPDDNSKPVVLQIGTKGNKNVKRLAEALSGLDVILDIVGPVNNELKAHLDRHNMDFRSSTGLTKEEIVQKYVHSHVVAFVSTYEGFGLPVIEAQAVGRPVVTSNIEPMKGISGGAACLVDPCDVAAIRQAVLRVIHDRSYREEIVAAGLENKERFTRARIVGRYMELYEKMIERAGEAN